MTARLRPIELTIYRTAIPMRRFEHAAAARDRAEAVVVRAAFDDGREGWGEALPRPYVTGETLDGVVAGLEEVIWPACVGRDLGAGGLAEAIPRQDGGGRCINAAACAFELACVDAAGGGAGERLDVLLGARQGVSGRIASRVSGVLGSGDPARTARRLRWMRWFGLRDFKLKLGLGDDVDAENLRVVDGRLARAVSAGRCTLRVDVNGGWDAAEVPARVAELRRYGVCVVEQPARCTGQELAELAARCELPLMADESLVTGEDARSLLAGPGRPWWNIRISKNGGVSPAVRLAQLAAEKGVPFVVGCMVGESGILSAAQRRLLQVAPAPRFVEGNYGRFLLADDLTRPSPRCGVAGRLGVLRGAGLGVRVVPGKLHRHGQLLRTLRG